MISLDFLSNDYEEKKSPAEKLQEELKIEILTGKIHPGQRIVEQHLCDRYHLSRTPVRDVLHHLEEEGLIEIIANRGALVRGLSNQEIDDLFSLKMLLEVHCVRLAISRITSQEMDTLNEIFDFIEFYTVSDDLEKVLRINQGFDAVIYNASHNRELEKTLHRYNFYLRYATPQTGYPANYLSAVLEEHRAIYQAFQQKDPEAGASATELHMMRTMIRRK